MSVLHKINPQVQRAVADAGLPMKAVKTRTRPWRDADEANYDTLLELNLEDTVRQEGGKVEEELIIDGEAMFYSIMRGALQVRGNVPSRNCVLFACSHVSCATSIGGFD
jgi:hypothetical protein